MHLFNISGLDTILHSNNADSEYVDADSGYGVADDLFDWFCSCNLDNHTVFLQYESKHGDGHVKTFWKLYDKLGKHIPQHQV